MKTCIACGMPMKAAEDFPGGDQSKDYCVYCAREDGTMQSYPEKLEGMTEFLVRTQGLDHGAAHETAVRLMSKLPAWKDMRTNA
ncbi:Putative zinc ribbon domain-containing protein [Sporobacter termitidis DSM 10068]|uniref:Putative zinc ribbon domain-containing protein n=1 Tax=Sporobacter termitidis DSM 10068 TaxID=1123282 RepID=A0A1M5TXT3_9FIRM|nr:zinc ribbon domain-containing protein [Sporobacter termitidis]SHH55587.1 Putative zinc ribbon domain-containing protein [Sporobacter termitidis DSM 10068]